VLGLKRNPITESKNLLIHLTLKMSIIKVSNLERYQITKSANLLVHLTLTMYIIQGVRLRAEPDNRISKSAHTSYIKNVYYTGRSYRDIACRRVGKFFTA
jgi:hypothetical protein